jgi:endonuclease/exonuclease/phosphatase family metal-dependent hydrolase
VIFLASLGMLVPVFASRHELTRDRGIRFSYRDRFMLGSVFLLLSCLVLFGTPKAKPIKVDATAQKTLKLMTYNIQQGYNKSGKKSYLEQVEVIRAENPDIIALQETDSVRIAGGNADIVRYYADQLNMYSYSGPTPVAGTFGIALLSKHPLIIPRTFFMFSSGEQTAAIQGKLNIGGQIINIFATHLGNEGPMVQQKAILDLLGKKKNVVLMGDFNFGPDTEQYFLTTSTLSDSWLEYQRYASENKAVLEDSYDLRIDHIFVSPELNVSSSRYLFSDHSDHPALVTEIKLK